MLKTIVIVTIAVLNLDSVETAYQDELGYTTVEQSSVTESQAAVWAAPHMQGSEYLLMKALDLKLELVNKTILHGRNCYVCLNKLNVFNGFNLKSSS